MINNYFSVNYSIKGKKYLIELQITSKKEKYIKNINKEIEKIVKKAIQLNKNKTSNIKILVEKNKIYILKGKEKIEYHSAKSPSPIAINSLKITQFGQRILTDRNRTLGEVFTHLAKQWPSKIPLVNLAWYLIVIPLSVFGKLLHPGRVFDLENLKIKVDPKHVMTLESTMHEVTEILKSATDPGSQEACSAFTNGLEFSKKWREGKPQDKKALTNQLAKQLTKDEEVSGKAKSLAVIPGGFWKNNQEFEPCLWSFYRDPEGNLCLSEMSYGLVDQSKGQIYSFGKAADEEKIQSLIYNLMTLSIPMKEFNELKDDHKLGLAYTNLLKNIIDVEKNIENLDSSTGSPRVIKLICPS